MNEEEMRKVWKRIKENQVKLKGCSRHLFILSGKYPFEYVCSNCGGRINSVNKIWYEIGLKHGEGGKNENSNE